MTETTYAGPVATSVLQFGGRPIRLVRPGDPDRLLDDPTVGDWNRRDDYMPYWAYLWPGAFLLAEVIAREPWPERANALEIGCGLGLAGLVALGRGLSVRFTDYDAAPLDFVRRSVAINGFDGLVFSTAPPYHTIGHAGRSVHPFDRQRFSTARLDWRDLPDERYDVILGADVLYERRLVPLVANLVARMLAEGGLALIADPYRVAAEGFGAEVERLGLGCEAVRVVAECAEFGLVRGTLHRVSRRA